ncbi:MAG TPA: hypothetical protein PKK18_06565 [Chitinophagales bacterium]|nr:hypothetical protein [Chitinophagales bacterium]HMW13889.1 hypothetical protein [Chitinophagales bacterium]HMX61400.1 hypothetical protein [Chitinophagales bacterium]HMY24627.1 hypothetical protein [Chitinophagales bacterium]HMZ33715.1 hypothetical protein [Chitinophagales bacterium]
MKNFVIANSILTLLFLCIVSVSNAQSGSQKQLSNLDFPLELSIKKNSETALSLPSREYVLQISNTSNYPVEFLINASNISCIANQKLQQLVFEYELNQVGKIIGSYILTLPPHSNLEFNLIIKNTSFTQLDSKNCTEVMAVNKNNEVLSNSISIETYIPDPSQFR